MSSEKLVIFVKAPRVGCVKTRLAHSIGPEAACAAYCSLVEIVLKNVAPIKDAELRFTPDDASAEIDPWLQPGWNTRPQGAGDLGARMHGAFLEHFGGGAERVVIIGSDCPDLSAADIESAWEALKTNDVVLGPASDGGYWLIGLRSVQPMLFDNMSWSTDTVFCETLRRAKAAGLKVHLLRQLSDIDTADDWKRFNETANSSGQRSER
jgi:uncharacterized protein